MRFRCIVRDFYRIRLTENLLELVDRHYTAAACWLICYQAAHRTEPTRAKYFWMLHRAHVSHLQKMIYEHGDFSRARDPEGLRHLRESWNPQTVFLFHPAAFANFVVDPKVAESVASYCSPSLNNVVDLYEGSIDVEASKLGLVGAA